MASKTHTSILKTQNYIAGKWIAKGDGTLTVRHKYTGSKLAGLPMATAAQMESALKAGRWGAHILWRLVRGQAAGTPSETLRPPGRASGSLCGLDRKGGGKPLSYAQNEVERCLLTLSTAAAECVRFAGEVVPLDFGAGEGKTAFTKRFPAGVIACITPFQLPPQSGAAQARTRPGGRLSCTPQACAPSALGGACFRCPGARGGLPQGGAKRLCV